MKSSAVMPKIKERDVENYLRRRVKENDGVIRKMEWVNRPHAPDNLVGLYGGHLVECKAPGAKPRPGQLREHERLRKTGIRVFVVSTFDEVDEFIKDVTKRFFHNG